jgi:hypothetical protein
LIHYPELRDLSYNLCTILTSLDIVVFLSDQVLLKVHRLIQSTRYPLPEHHRRYISQDADHIDQDTLLSRPLPPFSQVLASQDTLHKPGQDQRSAYVQRLPRFGPFRRGHTRNLKPGKSDGDPAKLVIICTLSNNPHNHLFAPGLKHLRLLIPPLCKAV